MNDDNPSAAKSCCCCRRRIYLIPLILLGVLLVAVVTFPWWQAFLPPIDVAAKVEHEVILDRSIMQVALIIARPETLRKMVEATGAELIERQVTEGGFEADRLMELLRGDDFHISIKADMKITSPDTFVKAPFLSMKQDIEVECGKIRVETYLSQPTSVLDQSRLVLLFTKGEGDQTLLRASLELDVSIRHLPMARGIIKERVAGAAKKHLDAEIDCLVEIVNSSPKIPFSGLQGIGEMLQGFLKRRPDPPEVDEGSL